MLVQFPESWQSIIASIRVPTSSRRLPTRWAVEWPTIFLDDQLQYERRWPPSRTTTCTAIVAGQGEGLTKIIAHANFINKKSQPDNCRNPESMGLFLQKTNIIRDYPEDMQRWQVVLASGNLAEICQFVGQFPPRTSREEPEVQALCCIRVVLNAMNHINDVLVYLWRERSFVFQLLCHPQVMAVATLAFTTIPMSPTRW